MDTGPQNVLGERPSLVDPLVRLLVSKMEPFIGKKDMEFEGRIGVICAPSDKRNRTGSSSSQKDRLILPVLTETVLASSESTTASGKPFRHEFEPNLDKKAFDKIKERLDQIFSKGTELPNPPNPLFKIIACNTSHTVDEIYKKPYSVRISYPWATYAEEGVEPIEIIAKEHVEKLDVWSGFFSDMEEEGVIEDEGRNRYPFDYRLAVNVEKKFPLKIAADFSKSDCVMKREKRRTTYDMKAWVVDMTHVSVIGASGGEADRYEVEVELKSDLLMEQLDRRSKGKFHGAYDILNDFLYFLRDICYVFGPNDETGQTSSRKLGYPEMASCEPSDQKKQKFVQVTGYNVFPIIGDYIYQISDEVRATPTS